MEALRPKARRAAGRGPSARLAIVDSQSARTTESGGPRGYDGNKKILGRKRHIVVDADGVPIVAAITTANTHDSQPAPALFREAKAVEPDLAEVFADSAYVGSPLQRAANDNGMELRIVRRSDPRSEFVPLPRRWVVERTFAWLGRSRRLSKDYERLPASSHAVLQLASIQLMLRRAA
jgi:putative transposase